jgi:hypothetical protein
VIPHTHPRMSSTDLNFEFTQSLLFLIIKSLNFIEILIILINKVKNNTFKNYRWIIRWIPKIPLFNIS